MTRTYLKKKKRNCKNEKRYCGKHKKRSDFNLKKRPSLDKFARALPIPILVLASICTDFDEIESNCQNVKPGCTLNTTPEYLCVWFSAFNFQLLTRTSGGATASRSVISFYNQYEGGPARTSHVLLIAKRLLM